MHDRLRSEIDYLRRPRGALFCVAAFERPRAAGPVRRSARSSSRSCNSRSTGRRLSRGVFNRTAMRACRSQTDWADPGVTAFQDVWPGRRPIARPVRASARMRQRPNARRLIRPLGLVHAAAFSPQLSGGQQQVGVSDKFSVVARLPAATQKGGTRPALRGSVSDPAMDLRGWYSAIHSALDLCPATPSNSFDSTQTDIAPAGCSTPQYSATSSRLLSIGGFRGGQATIGQAASRRPPIALGWPVSEKGPLPGLPVSARLRGADSDQCRYFSHCRALD